MTYSPPRPGEYRDPGAPRLNLKAMQRRKTRRAFQAFVVGLVCFVLTILLSGFVLMKLWQWHVADTFGVPQVNLMPAIGITVVFGFLVRTLARSKDTSEMGPREVVVHSIVQAQATALYLLVGYVVEVL